MSLYGGVINDSSGRQFARVDGGISYHYWGKITVQAAGSNGWVVVPLFNIPETVKISAFIFCDFGGNENIKSRYGKAEVRQLNGIWHARVLRSMGDAEPSFVSATFYVFVPARFIPGATYGMQCFDEAGIKVYDSSRPLLQICGVGAAGALTTGQAQFFNRTPDKVASAYCSTYSAQYMVVNGAAYWAVIAYYGTTTTGALGGYTGMVAWLDQGGTKPPNVQFTNIPLIDAGYYDQFSNLVNM
ncbi:hypothetical protein [Aeromonas salmonicida]|uniref:hypothetical protein n=1 Tax=Aeromonas salmonicida TaxID=645 RepID=UPI0030CB1D91